MSRDVCGICWCPIDNEGCGCAPKQPEAMRVADALEHQVYRGSYDWDRVDHMMLKASTELRRLQAENELLHKRCQQAYTVGRESGREDCEALLRQALDLLETMPVKHPDQITPRNTLSVSIKKMLQLSN